MGRFSKLWVRLRGFRDDSYPILFSESGLEQNLPQVLKNNPHSRIALICDEHLSHLYRDRFDSWFGKSCQLFTIPAGESEKTATTVLSLADRLSGANFDRKTLVIAIGGGVTGDMAGFLSSIYLRGIPFVQIPTSLLAMVDSSIGGKTGVDTAAGKNMIGAFKQPKAVLIDTSFLSSLPADEFINGMAEVIKYGCILDASYFRWLRENHDRVMALEPAALTFMIRRSCEFKRMVVEKDEKETGLRQILNFGHTAGHAIESASGFRIPHGFSVALGMLVETRWSVALGLTPENTLTELEACLSNFGLLKFRELSKQLHMNDILSHIASDKKNSGKKVNSVLLQQIGKTYRKNNRFSFEIPQELLQSGPMWDR